MRINNIRSDAPSTERVLDNRRMDNRRSEERSHEKLSDNRMRMDNIRSDELSSKWVLHNRGIDSRMFDERSTESLSENRKSVHKRRFDGRSDEILSVNRMRVENGRSDVHSTEGLLDNRRIDNRRSEERSNEKLSDSRMRIANRRYDETFAERLARSDESSTLSLSDNERRINTKPSTGSYDERLSDNSRRIDNRRADKRSVDEQVSSMLSNERVNGRMMLDNKMSLINRHYIDRDTLSAVPLDNFDSITERQEELSKEIVGVLTKRRDNGKKMFPITLSFDRIESQQSVLHDEGNVRKSLEFGFSTAASRLIEKIQSATGFKTEPQVFKSVMNHTDISQLEGRHGRGAALWAGVALLWAMAALPAPAKLC